MKKLFLLTTLLIPVFSFAANDTIAARDFGIVPNTYANSTAALIKALEYCKAHNSAVLKFESGRYDIWPENAVRKELYISNTSSETECPSKEKTIGICLDGLKNFTVEGNGATFMMHGSITPLAAIACEKLKLKDFTIDFERPGGSELTYTAVRPREVEVAVHRDTRYDIVNNRLNLIGEGWKSNRVHCIKYTPGDRHFVYSNDWNVLSKCDVKEIGRGKLLFTTPQDFKPETGATLTLRDIIRSQVGMLLLECNGVELERLNVRYMHGLGIVSQFSRDLTYKEINCRPSEESGRLLASSADFMHFSGCSGAIEIDRCNFAGAHDDCINVHGTNLQIQETPAENVAIVRFMHPQSYGFNAFWPGDTVAIVNPSTMLRESTAIVESAEALNPRNVKLTFKSALPKNIVLKATCIENITKTPTLRVGNCNFTRTSTRGILCTTPRKVVIENNKFDRLGMSAILIEGDAEGWYESGAVCDVTIRNNTFIDCAYSGGPERATIALNPSNKIIDKKKPVHSNITITDNVFNTEGRPVLFAKSTANISFTNNVIEGNNPPTFILKGCNSMKIKPKGNDYKIINE